MKSLKQFAAGALMCLLAAGAAAQVNVSGIKYDESVDARGTKLQLNGAGVRYKAVFKVYTAGLYLSQKAERPKRHWPPPAPSASASPCCARSIPTNWANCSRGRGRQHGQGEYVFQAGAGRDAHEPDLLGPQEAGAG
jgi:hypothetical protein